MTGRLGIAVALLAFAGATVLVVFSNGHGFVRIALALGFLSIAPGWVVVRLVDPPLDVLGRAAIAVAVSISVDMAVATALIYLQIWSVELALTIVAAFVVVGVLLDLPASRAVIQRGARQAWSALNDLGRP